MVMIACIASDWLLINPVQVLTKTLVLEAIKQQGHLRTLSQKSCLSSDHQKCSRAADLNCAEPGDQIWQHFLRSPCITRHSMLGGRSCAEAAYLQKSWVLPAASKAHSALSALRASPWLLRRRAWRPRAD